MIERRPGKLPSTAEVSPKQATMAVTLQSGKVLDEPVYRPKEKVKKQEKQLNEKRTRWDWRKGA